MASILQPFNSKVRITPFSQRLLQYGVSDSKIYLSKASNSLLSSFTMGFDEGFIVPTTPNAVDPKYDYRDSCILDGLSTKWELQNNILKVTVSPGTLIVDTTLLIFPQPTTIDLNLTNYGSGNECGKIIISVNFQWIDSVYENTPKLKISYLDYTDNSIVLPNDWYLNQDKLIINVIEFSKNTSGNVEFSSIKSLVPEPCNNINHDIIHIKDYPYEIAPLSKFWYNTLNTIENHYVRKKVVNIPGYVDPIGLPNSEFPMNLNFEDIDTINMLTLEFDVNITNSNNIQNITFENGPSVSNSFKVVTINTTNAYNTLHVRVSSPNMIPIQTGLLGTLICELTSSAVKNSVMNFTLSNVVGLDDASLSHNLNGAIGITPQVTVTPSYTVNRPSPPPTTLSVDELSYVWKYSNSPISTEPIKYFKSEIDIQSLHNREDFVVQCYINNFQITPAHIQIDLPLVTIWMPETFIEQNNPIPELKVVIIG